jgi:hypothetical protein
MEKIMTKRISINPIIGGLFAALFVFLFISFVMNIQNKGWIDWFNLSIDGKNTSATIISVDNTNHNTCKFEYLVNGKKYFSSDQGCNVKVGQSVFVTYLPAEPSFGTLSSPLGVLLSLIFMPLLFSIIAGLGLAFRLHQDRLKAP